MVFYNVTCNIGQEIELEWVDWMKQEHLPEVMATGVFESYTFCKLLTEAADNEGLNFTIQYKTESLIKLEEYNNLYGPTLRQKTLDKWGEKVLAFRSVMEEI